VASDEWMSCRSSASAQRGLETEALGGFSTAQDYLAFAGEVARGAARRPLYRGDLLAERLPFGDERQQLAVEFGECRAQFIEVHRGSTPFRASRLL
jgi:hypothetical protein